MCYSFSRPFFHYFSFHRSKDAMKFLKKKKKTYNREEIMLKHKNETRIEEEKKIF